MNTIYKLFFAAVVVMTASPTILAQNEDEIEYDPIHSTILPGDGRLHIQENHGKNSSVFLIGDELMFKSHKGEPAQLEFELPLNPIQDYTLELTFITSNLNKGFVFFGSDLFFMRLGPKLVQVLTQQETVFEDKKWKWPKSEVKDELVCKIERHKKNYTFFVNNTYVCETTINQYGSSFPFIITLSGSKSEILLKSIRVDQGAENDN